MSPPCALWQIVTARLPAQCWWIHRRKPPVYTQTLQKRLSVSDTARSFEDSPTLCKAFIFFPRWKTRAFRRNNNFLRFSSPGKFFSLGFFSFFPPKSETRRFCVKIKMILIPEYFCPVVTKANCKPGHEKKPYLILSERSEEKRKKENPKTPHYECRGSITPTKNISHKELIKSKHFGSLLSQDHASFQRFHSFHKSLDYRFPSSLNFYFLKKTTTTTTNK